jgi:hypothetical protein
VKPSAFAVILLALGVVAPLLAACGGGEGETTPAPATVASSPSMTPTPTEAPPLTPATEPTPAPTSVLTPAPTPPPTPVPEPPNAAPIHVDPGVNNLGEGVIQPVLAPSGVLNLDPGDLAQGLGIASPDCAEFVLYLSWRVRQPHPPSGVDLEFYWTRMGGTELFAEGPSGQASRGCGAIQVVNNSAIEVRVEIRYVIGQLSP